MFLSCCLYLLFTFLIISCSLILVENQAYLGNYEELFQSLLCCTQLKLAYITSSACWSKINKPIWLKITSMLLMATTNAEKVTRYSNLILAKHWMIRWWSILLKNTVVLCTVSLVLIWVIRIGRGSTCHSYINVAFTFHSFSFCVDFLDKICKWLALTCSVYKRLTSILCLF